MNLASFYQFSWFGVSIIWKRITHHVGTLEESMRLRLDHDFMWSCSLMHPQTTSLWQGKMSRELQFHMHAYGWFCHVRQFRWYCINTSLSVWTLPHATFTATVDKSTVQTAEWFWDVSREGLLVGFTVETHLITRITMWTHSRFILSWSILLDQSPSGFKFHIGNHKCDHVKQPVHLTQFVSCIMAWLITYLRSLLKAQSS